MTAASDNVYVGRKITLPAPAKINLFLHVVGTRPNGYHDLQSVFTYLDYCDELTFEVTDTEKVEIFPEGVVELKDNLIYKAYQMMEVYRPRNTGLKIYTEKNIPSFGGLGGGSSDAATTYYALAYLWNLDFSKVPDATESSKLGADIPFFVGGETAFVEGIGEILKPVDIPERWYLIIHPNEKVSTKKVFQHPELNCATAKISDTQLFDFKWDNDLEPLVRDLYPAVDNAVRWLRLYSDNARMTGSGACVFGEFDSENEARNVYERIPEGWNAFIAKGCQKSPLFEKLSLVSKNFKL